MYSLLKHQKKGDVMANIFKYTTCTNPDCKKQSTVTTETKKVPKCTKCGTDMKYARKWSYRFMFEYEPYKRTFSESKRDTQIAMEEHRRQLETGIAPNKKIKRYTFAELVDKYKNFCKNHKSYEHSKKFSIDVLKRRYGNKYIDTFNTLDIDELKADYLKAHAKSTVNSYLILIQHMIRKAVNWEMAPEEILKKVKGVKKEKVKNRLRYLTDKEKTTLLDACADHLKPIVKFALNTGMRRGEIFNLQWKDIDFNNNLIWIQSGMQKNDELSSIPINQTVRNLLKSIPRRLDIPYVFYSKKGGKVNTVKTAFNAACRRAKIHDFRFHDLRHDFASTLVQKKVPIKQIQELMRHKSIEMTLKYAHVTPKDLADAVALLDQVAV